MVEIRNVNEEQRHDIEQTSQAITDLDSNTQQNSALAEPATAATQSVSEQTDRLVQLAAGFRLD